MCMTRMSIASIMETWIMSRRFRLVVSARGTAGLSWIGAVTVRATASANQDWRPACAHVLTLCARIQATQRRMDTRHAPPVPQCARREILRTCLCSSPRKNRGMMMTRLRTCTNSMYSSSLDHEPLTSMGCVDKALSRDSSTDCDCSLHAARAI